MSKMISFKNTFQIHAFAQYPPIDSFCHSEQKPKSFWWHVRFPVQKDPLEKEIATHSNILAWKIPWTEKPGRLQSMGSQRVGHDWATSLHKVPLIWHPASSSTYLLSFLLPSVHSTQPAWVSWWFQNMPTCLTAFALVWNTLPQDTCLTSYLRILTSLLKSHVTTEYCCLCLDFPKSRAWNKSLNECGFGRKLIPRKGVKEEGVKTKPRVS